MVELSTFSFWIVYPLPVLFVLLSFTPREVRVEGWKVVISVLKALGLYRSELGTTALALLVCLVAVSIVIDFFGAASSLRQALRLQRQMRMTEDRDQRERLQCLRWEAETNQWLSTFVLGLWVIAFGFFLRLTEIEMLRMRMSKLQKQFTQNKHGRNAHEPEKAPTPSLDMWAMRSPKAVTCPGSTTRIRRFDFEAEEKRESDTTRIVELEELVHKLQAENDGLHAKLTGLHHKIPAGKRGVE